MTAPNAHLQRVLEDEDWRVFPLLTGRLLLGRARDCDLRLEGDHLVSRHHAELVRQEGEWFVRDLGSSNGTLLNGLKVVRSRIANGDCLVKNARALSDARF